MFFFSFFPQQSDFFLISLPNSGNYARVSDKGSQITQTSGLPKRFFFIAGKAVLHISGRLKLQQDHPIINFPLFITFA